MNPNIRAMIRGDPRCYVPDGEDRDNPKVLFNDFGEVHDFRV
jgi:hypothetical protein